MYFIGAYIEPGCVSVNESCLTLRLYLEAHPQIPDKFVPPTEYEFNNLHMYLHQISAQ